MDKELLQKLALFNKFELSGAEEERLLAEFDRTLKRLEPLTRTKLDDTPIMVWADGVAPVYREDVRAKTVSREEILRQAPEQAENCFAVPRVAD
ncbi:MAG: aspartyl/glutamyl-tRNA amidotransferase subunit C [Firmicutes bacterium]|nr:aspartyl/glutamyl-tRNA amidotransferase subunit C [Bacillota bacterium]